MSGVRPRKTPIEASEPILTPAKDCRHLTATAAHSETMKIEDIGNALPSANRRAYREKQNATDQPMPKSLPECFAEVWRRRKSALPVHRRERATLEAVAATIPSDAAGLTGQAAAAVYLGALIASLDRLIQTTTPTQPTDGKAPSENPQNLSKKKRKEIRREVLRAEEQVKDMTTTDVLKPMMASTETEAMKVEDGDAGKKSEDAELIASLMYLISSAMGGSSTAILQAKGVQILDVVVRAMNHVPDHCLTARHASTCICQMLSIVDASLWSKPVVQRSYLYLIRLTMDRDAKTRKKAREALHELLSGPRFPLIRSKTSGTASSHFIAALASHTASMKSADHSSLGSLPASLVHTLTSIEQFATFLQPHHAARVAKEILLLAANQTQNIASFALLALWSVLKHQVQGEGGATDSEPCKSFLPSKDISKLMTALLRLDMDEDSSQEWRIAYCSCAVDGAIAYADYFTHTPPPLELVSKPVFKVCEALKVGNLERPAVNRLTWCLQRLVSHRWVAKREIVMNALRELLDDRYDNMRTNIMRVIKTYLEQGMSAGNPQMEESIVDFIKYCRTKRDLSRREEDRKGEAMSMSLLASVIRGGGAARILTVVSVKYDLKQHVSNAWILPLLLNNLRGAPLSIFFGQFVPLANKLKQAQQACEGQKRVIEAKIIGHYHAQILGLLPGFCTSPSDLIQEGLLSEAFKTIHSCMTSEKDKEMITIGADALRRLSLSVAEKSDVDLNAKQLSSSFASRLKKLFPTICDVAENVQDKSRESILLAVVTSCQATRNPAFVSSLLKKTIRRLLELQLSSTKANEDDGAMTDKDSSAINRAQHAAADLAISIIESKTLPTDAAELVFLEKAISPFLTDAKESALQKKAYRSATLLVETREASKDSSELLDFVKRVSDQAKTVAPGAKASRLGLIEVLIERYSKFETVEEKTKYLQSMNNGFLPEILLGTRDSSEKTRAASFTTLIALSRSWNICIPGANSDGLQQFFMAVAAGLAGKTVSLLAATLTSFGRLMYDFRGEIAMNEDLSTFVDSLFATQVSVEDDTTMSVEDEDGAVQTRIIIEPGPIAILLRHNVVEVQKAALGVIKVATKSLSLPVSKTRLSDILPGIIPGLVHVAARSKKQETRLRVRVILERLLRKCGREALESHFPADHVKLLAAVRKKYSRDLIKKHVQKENRANRIQPSKATSNGNDDMSEGDSELDNSDSDVEREILDGDKLLSQHTADGIRDKDKNKKGSSSGPSNLNNRSAYDIKYTDDGKPIFVESDAESGDAEAGSVYNDDSDDDRGPRDEKMSIRKRKRSDRDNFEDSGKRMKGSFGEEYRGKRAKGDIKRPGRPDPYAFVPLGQSMVGKGVRIGRSASKTDKRGSSLRRLADGVSSKRRVRKLGIPGRR